MKEVGEITLSVAVFLVQRKRYLLTPFSVFDLSILFVSLWSNALENAV